MFFIWTFSLLKYKWLKNHQANHRGMFYLRLAFVYIRTFETGKK